VSPADRPVLRIGDRGPWVAVVQDRLSGWTTQLVTDGIFGPRTEAAVLAAQSDGGLPATGVVDAATWERLVGGPSSLPTESMLDDPILVDVDGATRVLPILGGGPVPRLGAPAMVLWDAG
jgi:hypothetical protein